MKGKLPTQRLRYSTVSVSDFPSDTNRLSKTKEEAFPTIEGIIITKSAKLAAVKQGAGVMIGDHFVGSATCSDYSFSFPDIVY